MKLVMGIDNGTQSTKVILYDFVNKHIVAEATSPHDLISENDGTKEQKAHWWITALKKCIGEFDANLKKSVIAIGVSGQQHGFVPLDREGNVLYNVKLWCDTSTVEECKQITVAFGGEKKLLDEVGNLILPGYTASKILWLKNNAPDLYSKLHTVLLPHDYLNFYLTGNKVMEYGDASGTGLLNIRTRQWSNEILLAIDPERDLSKLLPVLIDSRDPAGILQANIAEELDLPADIIVSSGGGDNMMAAIGTGCVEQGVVSMSLGTSGTLYGYSEKPIVDKNLAGFCSSNNGWLPLLCTMNCTVALEQVKKLFDMELSEIESSVTDSPVGCEGVITLPFYNGERAPNLPNGRGCIVGLTMNNMKKANILRSSMESAIFGMKYGLDALKELGFSPKEVRLTGGGANSKTWCQIAADTFNLPVNVTDVNEGAAFGAAIQALWCYETSIYETASLEKIVSEHVRVNNDKRHLPIKENSEKYQKIYTNYKQYITALSDIFE